MGVCDTTLVMAHDLVHDGCVDAYAYLLYMFASTFIVVGLAACKACFCTCTSVMNDIVRPCCIGWARLFHVIVQ
jgi:hypothetical protein